MQVLIGGGENHRMGLFDMVMVKDNHIAVAGGIPQAISAVETYLNSKNLDIGVEVFNIFEVSLFAFISQVYKATAFKVSMSAISCIILVILVVTSRLYCVAVKHLANLSFSLAFLICYEAMLGSWMNCCCS